MRRCLCGAVSSSPSCPCPCPSLCLRLWRVAACARSLFVSVSAASTSIRKIITLDMIEYTAEYILYQREVPVPVASCVATASGRKANPFQCPVQSQRPLPSKRPSACLTAAALAVDGHSFLRSQWAIPVSALVCSTLTCRINVSGHNVVFVAHSAQCTLFLTSAKIQQMLDICGDIDIMF